MLVVKVSKHYQKLFQEKTAPTENKESTQQIEKFKDLETRPQGLYLHIDIDLVCLGLFLLALCTRLYNLEEPRYIV